jgi:aminoglycoside phosphotransferase (APT) family kinase protein
VRTIEESPESLRRRLERIVEAWRPGAGVSGLRRLVGGLSSETFLVHVDNEPVVVKTAPPGREPVRNLDVLRQAVLLTRLEGAEAVALPRVLFTDMGAPPEVPPLFGMNYIDGESYEPILDRVDNPPPAATTRARMLDAAHILGHLHVIDPAAVGLGNEPVVELAAQVERWTRSLESLGQDLRPDFERCRARLLRTLPPPVRPSLTHGDYRVGNALCVGDRVAAVIDWEIWAHEDPRLDLCWFLQWADPTLPSALLPPPPGIPAPAELVEEYAAIVFDDGAVPDLEWFQALTYYKHAAIAGLTVKRNRKRQVPDPSIERNAANLPILLDRALTLLA